MAPRHSGFLQDRKGSLIMKRSTFGSCSFRAARNHAPATEDGSSASQLKVAWWLWPNLLSLDAPLIAGLWAVFFGKVFFIEINPASILVLMMCVWGIYTSDRLLDGYNCSNPTKLRQRHNFASAHRESLSFLAALAGAISVALSLLFLSSQQIEAGLALCLLVVAYLFSVHAAPQNLRNSLPKEYLVGALFAAGTVLPLCPTRDHAPLLFTLILFAHLCSLNCLAIECWEAKEDSICASSQGFADSSALRRQVAVGTVLLTLVAIVASAANRFGAGPRPGLLGIAAAATFLATVHINRNRLTAEQLRVLADVALAVPALVGILALANSRSWEAT
jgi:membrane protein YdbS with pleckstrin-like domain